MSYIVFARKWRPQNFDELVGQHHITTTLKNAISGNRIAHAYLFTGPRGIGKTTTARIFAKALNCKDGPTPVPCNSCLSCKEISDGVSLDVLEIDGASNRGIDEIRNLRENVKFSPAGGRFKIYIIDEVHMLTQEAFNALLKTLEEPPAHVKFIFATTRPHKVLPTILSRCQRFDFKKIGLSDLVGKMKLIAKQEGLDVTEDALFAIARASDGSMRDSESILDQLSSFCEKRIGLEDVALVLGMVDQEILFELTQKIIEKDTSAALKVVDRLVNEGKDIPQFLLSLIDHFRNLIVAKVGGDLKALIELPADSTGRVLKQSQSFSTEDLLYIFQVLSNTQEAIKRPGLARIPLEMAMVKLTQRESIISLKEILSKLSELERRLQETTHNAEGPRDNVEVAEKLKPKIGEYEAAGVMRAEPQTETSPLQQAAEEAQPDKKASGLTLNQIKDIWPDLLNRVGAKKGSTHSYLSESRPIKVEGDLLTIGLEPKFLFYKEGLETKENRRLIERTLNEILGTDMKTAFDLVDFDQQLEPLNNQEEREAMEPPPDASAPEKQPPPAEAKESEEIEPIIQSAIKIFDGKIVRSKPR